MHKMENQRKNIKTPFCPIYWLLLRITLPGKERTLSYYTIQNILVASTRSVLFNHLRKITGHCPRKFFQTPSELSPTQVLRDSHCSDIFPLQMTFVHLRTYYTQNHMVRTPLGRVSFIKHNVFEFHLYCYIVGSLSLYSAEQYSFV